MPISGRGFERFAQLEQLGDGVPVAAGEGEVQDFFNARPREIWTGLAIGKIDEEFATAEVEFFGSNIHGQERFSRLCAGFTPEECDNKLASAQHRKQTTPAMPSGKAVLEAYVAARNRHDFAGLDTLLAADAIHEDIAQQFRGQGLAQIKDFMRSIIEPHPDLNWRVTTIVDTGSVVSAEWTWASTYTGDTPSGPVRAKRISARGASVAVIENGRIKRFPDYYDMASASRETPAGSAATDKIERMPGW